MLECLKPFGDAAVKWGRGPLPRCPLIVRGVASGALRGLALSVWWSREPFPRCPPVVRRPASGRWRGTIHTAGPRPPPPGARRGDSRARPGRAPCGAAKNYRCVGRGLGRVALGLSGLVWEYRVGPPRVIGSRLGVWGRSPLGYRVSFGSTRSAEKNYRLQNVSR